MKAERHLPVHSHQERQILLYPNVRTLAHVIGRSVAKHIVKCFFLGDVLRCFPDDDSQLYFVIWDVLRDWLGGFGNVYGRIWANDSRRRLAEESWGAGKKLGIRTSPWKRRRSLLGFLHISLSLRRTRQLNMAEHKDIRRMTNCMVGVIQSKTASESNMLPGQRRKQRLHTQDIFGELCGGVER